MMPGTIPTGSLLIRASTDPPLGRHFGVYLGDGVVLDVQKHDLTYARIRTVVFDEFAEKKRVTYVAPPKDFQPVEFWSRVTQARTAGYLKYGLLGQGSDWNCESLANWLVGGQRRSYQGDHASAVLGAFFAAAIGTGLVLISRRTGR